MRGRTRGTPAPRERKDRELRARLVASEGKLRALQAPEVDALVVPTEQGARIFTLQSAESIYRVLIEDLNEGAATLSADGTILYSNRRFAEMLKAPLEQVIGSSLCTWIVPADRELCQHWLGGGREARRAEVRMTAADEGQVPAYLSLSAFGMDEQAPAFCLVATDLTEQKRSESVIASETLSRAILEQASEAILVCDESGQVIRANSKVHALFGPSALGQPFPNLLPVMFADGSRLSLDAVQGGEVFQGVEVRLQRNGVKMDLLLSAGPLVGPEEQILGYLIALTDITEFKRVQSQALAAQAELRHLLEEANISRRALLSVVEDQRAAEGALRESQEQMRLLLDSTAEGIYGLDLEGRCTFCNAASLRMLGFSRPEDLVGRPMHALIHSRKADRSELVPEECPVCQAFLQGRESHVSDEVLWRADGTSFPAEYWAYPIRHDGEVLGAVVAFLDITEHKRAEEQLRQASKMEAIGVLAGGVAHDFNNLLTIINGYAQLIMDRCPVENPNHAQLEEIVKAGDRAVALTRQLLAFGRRQVLAPKVLDLGEVVQNISRMLRRLIGEDIELVVSTRAELGRVRADPGQIEQVLMNLAVNARDAMPQGGKLTLEISNVELDEAYALGRPGVAPGHYVMMAVSDSGSGMDAETKAHIFEPFFTTKEKGKGTGLGLATVHGIVNQSGGHIWVYSVQGQGTTFKIYLPRLTEAEALPKESQESAPLPRGSETILLVEDEAPVRDLAAQILHQQGYKMLAYPSPEDAVRLIERQEVRVDLLLTDVVMPGMSGRKLAEKACALHPDLRVLFMSGYTDDTIVRHGVLEAKTAFLQKPFTSGTLARKVREALDTPCPVANVQGVKTAGK